MTSRPSRIATPQRWRSLALAGVTAGVTAGIAVPLPIFAQTAPVQLTAQKAAENLWLAQAEGGEGGEAGAIAEVPDEVAYLARLSIVEGHIAASALLYRKGLKDEAIGLSYHPEAEMMEEVRETLAAHNVPDITPSMTAFSETMEKGASAEEVDAAFVQVSAAIAAAQQPAATAYRNRLDALVTLLRAASNEYTESTEGGVVEDVIPYHEAYGFVQTARTLATSLAAAPDTKAAAAGIRALDAMKSADEAFGDIMGATPFVGDANILLSVAARVELIASSVR